MSKFGRNKKKNSDKEHTKDKIIGHKLGQNSFLTYLKARSWERKLEEELYLHSFIAKKISQNSNCMQL